jgi:hypothetical protein
LFPGSLEEAVTIKIVRSTVDLVAVRAVLWELVGTTQTHPGTASTLAYCSATSLSS